MNPLLLLIMNKFLLIYMTKTYCLGGRHYSNTNKITQYEKVNPKTKKLVKIIKGKCAICNRKKSQFFTK